MQSNFLWAIGEEGCLKTWKSIFVFSNDQRLWTSDHLKAGSDETGPQTFAAFSPSFWPIHAQKCSFLTLIRDPDGNIVEFVPMETLLPISVSFHNVVSPPAGFPVLYKSLINFS